MRARSIGRRSFAMLVLSLALAGAVHAGRQPSVLENRLEFEVPDLNGEIVSATDDRFGGKVLLVNLWGTWCPPCLTEIPTFVDLQERYGEQGLTIVAIAFEHGESDRSRRKFLRSFAEQQGINYLVLDGGPPEDFGEVLPRLENVRGLPIEILIDRQGAVVASRNGYGYKKKWARKLEAEIQQLLAEPAR